MVQLFLDQGPHQKPHQDGEKDDSQTEVMARYQRVNQDQQVEYRLDNDGRKHAFSFSVPIPINDSRTSGLLSLFFSLRQAGDAELLVQLFGQSVPGFVFDGVVINDDDDIGWSGQLSLLASSQFVKPASDTVAGDGRFVYLTADHHRQPILIAPGVSYCLDREQRSTDRPSVVVHIP